MRLHSSGSVASAICMSTETERERIAVLCEDLGELLLELGDPRVALGDVGCRGALDAFGPGGVVLCQLLQHDVP